MTSSVAQAVAALKYIRLFACQMTFLLYEGFLLSCTG